MTLINKLLTGHAPSERREHLRRYLLACVRDNVLSFADITSAPHKIMSTINADIIALLKDFKSNLKTGAGGILRAMGEIAQDVVAGRRK